MGVRLNKVLTELNIGLQTAIDYLKNKKSLGEIKDDANVNTKISDEQYEALVKEFKGDKDVKTQAGMIFPKKKEKEKEKPKKEVKPEPVAEKKEEPRQTFTPLGKIDLTQVGKPARPKEEPKPEKV
jgi:translation initiation factor IF-2